MGPKARIEVLIFGAIAGGYWVLKSLGIIQSVSSAGYLVTCVLVVAMVLDSQFEDRTDRIEGLLKDLSERLDEIEQLLATHK
jgi:hypothetical protein